MILIYLASSVENDLAFRINQCISNAVKEVDAAIPGMFDGAEANNLASIDNNAEQIQTIYQQTLNGGFRGMAIFVAIVALIGLVTLIPYKDNRPGHKNEPGA